LLSVFKIAYLYDYQININNIVYFAKSIKDFRLNRKKLHPVENIVFITVIAVICNVQDWEEIEDFGNSRRDFFFKP